MKQRLAIVGFGGQGKLFFNAANRLLADSLEVVAICDTDPRAYTEMPGNESWRTLSPKEIDEGDAAQTRSYQDYRELLRVEKPDIVVVSTWTKDHADVVEAAAISGVKKILCEMPIASSLRDARRIIDICLEYRILLTVNHSRRWLPDHQEIRRLIREEKVIGDLRHIWISCGGARLSDLGTHWIDWALWVVGERVVKVFGKLDEVAGKNPRGELFTDFPGEIFMIFKSGATAFIHQGQGVALPPRYEIVGTRGRILGEQLPVKWRVEIRLEKNPDSVRGYYGEMIEIPFQCNPKIDVEALAAAPLRELIEGKTSCDGEDGYHTLEVLIAAHFTENSLTQLPLNSSAIHQYHLQSA
ncbi:MAG: Gfo/Idh/MocA family oxidoreductase [bacterium]|nr:Gfo/Idh/MocA family oxidoreductase [bacterium]